MPDWQWVSAELGRRGVTLMLVWEEYRQQHRDGYSYSQFRRHFLDHTSAGAEPRMRREHAPGAACEVDYAGMTLTISTAEGPRQASIFVASLPFSALCRSDLDPNGRGLAGQPCPDVQPS